MIAPLIQLGIAALLSYGLFATIRSDRRKKRGEESGMDWGFGDGGGDGGDGGDGGGGD